MILAPMPRAAAVPRLLVLNLLPLWLVLAGHAETPDLLAAYALECWVLLVLAAPAYPGLVRRMFATRLRDGFAVLAWTFLLTVALVALTVRVTLRVTWDAGSVLAVLGVATGLGLSLWAAWRHHGSPVPGRRGAPGAFAWRYLLFVVGAWFGLDAADDYARLLAHGWEPAVLGDAWAFPLVSRLLEASIALDLPAAAIPTLMLVLVRTVNEVLHEVYLICAEADRAEADRVTVEGASSVDR